MSKHEHEFYWYSAINEEGWKCCGCDYKPGEPPGFDPKRDRDEILLKAGCILHDLADANLIHVSNGSAGDGIAWEVAARCRLTGYYDQHSIIHFIFEGDNHAEYWRDVSEGVLSGNDPRKRCACGKLATCSTGTKEGWLYRCSDCWQASDEVL